MDDPKKFYVTANRILDIEAISDAEYTPKRDGQDSELVIHFKNGGMCLMLEGDAADDAWEDYQDTLDWGRAFVAGRPLGHRRVVERAKKVAELSTTA